jgi:hypothetical protein
MLTAKNQWYKHAFVERGVNVEAEKERKGKGKREGGGAVDYSL